jgi:hypothetical protein
MVITLKLFFVCILYNWLGVGNQEINSWQGQEILLSYIASGSALGSTQCPIRWELGDILRDVAGTPPIPNPSSCVVLNHAQGQLDLTFTQAD